MTTPARHVAAVLLTVALFVAAFIVSWQLMPT